MAHEITDPRQAGRWKIAALAVPCLLFPLLVPALAQQTATSILAPGEAAVTGFSGALDSDADCAGH